MCVCTGGVMLFLFKGTKKCVSTWTECVCTHALVMTEEGFDTRKPLWPQRKHEKKLFSCCCFVAGVYSKGGKQTKQRHSAPYRQKQHLLNLPVAVFDLRITQSLSFAPLLPHLPHHPPHVIDLHHCPTGGELYPELSKCRPHGAECPAAEPAEQRGG